ncbi:MAG: DNA polymerase III subunit beta [bacterium]|nr:DNA polymerase III subunit beta [bacterium]
MKVRVQRAELADALTAACSVAPTRSPKPILQCVLLEAATDHCRLQATDLEIGIRALLSQVEVAEEGSTLVAADKLAQIVRESTDDVLEIETDETTCHVRGAASHFQIYCQEPAEFPPVADLAGEPDFEIEPAVLKRLTEWTVIAAARESTRYAINGVLWDQRGTKLTLVATDGRRLARAAGAVQAAGEPEHRAIVPSKAMHLFQRVLGEGSDPIALKITDSQIVARSPRMVVTAGLVEGQFPQYEEVIPNDCDKELDLPTLQFLGAVKQAALLTNEESRGVRFSLSPDRLTLSSRAPEQGEATIDLEVSYAGPPIDIGFNPVFLIEALRVVRTDSVKLQLKDAKRPGVLLGGEDLLCVVMPVNLS